MVFYSDMTNNRLLEWLYFLVNIVFGVRDIKPATELFGPSSYLIADILIKVLQKCSLGSPL